MMSERVERAMRAIMPANPEPTLAYINDADALLRQRYTYRFDRDNWIQGYKNDNWQSLIPEMQRRWEQGDDERVPGDCDDPSLTVNDAALWAGFDEADLYFLLVMSPMGRILNPQHDLDHAIGALRYEGKLYVIGDTFGACYPAELCQHELYAAHRYPLGSNDFYRVQDWSEV